MSGFKEFVKLFSSSSKQEKPGKRNGTRTSQTAEEHDQQLSISNSGTSQAEGGFRLLANRKFATFADSTFFLPCDEEEMQRDTLSHYILKIAFGKNCMAPIEDSLGAGGNIIDGIPYRDGTFDYVILRRLCLSLKAERWPALLDEMFRVAGKGGYVELVEINPFCMRVGPANTAIQEKLNEICASRGTDPNISTNLKVFLREAGFVNIQHGFVSIPVGNWGDNKIGGMMGRNYREALAAVSPFMAPQLGKTPKQYDEYLDTCLAECNEFQAYSNAYWAYAQRP
ncbi:hypothetical protein BC938DRAFT_472343, partial [Jimgerdemannia flammicorona]